MLSGVNIAMEMMGRIRSTMTDVHRGFARALAGQKSRLTTNRPVRCDVQVSPLCSGSGV